MDFFWGTRGGAGGGLEGRGGRTNERPGTDHVISGPKRGLGKTAPDGIEPQTDGMATL